MARISLRQRADLTHKHNMYLGRHGWLRLTPAYSVKVVAKALRNAKGLLYVLDPFSGTATTALAAAEQGHRALGVDINPFLVWLGNAKLAAYSQAEMTFAREFCESAHSSTNVPAVAPPPIRNIERWWHPVVLQALCELKGAVDRAASECAGAADLMLLAFCQTLIKVSNAAFNHQSMSFKGKSAKLAHTPEQCRETFCRCLEDILGAVRPNCKGEGAVVLADSRDAPPEAPFDLLLTSPPYPNRMSYIRELRPYMYWLGYLKEARQAGELDWKAIGGTWGVATSRLSEWKPSGDPFLPASLLDAVDRIEDAQGKNGRILAAYVHKYFCDMWEHFRAVSRVMKPGGKAVYIIGNSTFYGVMVAAEEVYAEMLREVGFVNVRIAPIRKRNSKKELYEFAVEADYAERSDLGTLAAMPPVEPPRLFK